MKRFVIIEILLLLTVTIKAQNADSFKNSNFFFSMGCGPLYGNMIDKQLIGETTIQGPGLQVDIKPGLKIVPNLYLHGTFILNMVPNADANGPYYHRKIKRLSEKLIGGGLTYYFMPANVFISGSIGSAYFKIIDPDYSVYNTITGRGFSFQLKSGKEWTISDNFDVGISLTYNGSRVTHFTTGGDESLTSNSFGLLMNITFL